MLSDAFPDLRNSTPGNIQCEALPALRHLVVVNNMADASAYEREVMDARCIVDWREAFVWRRKGVEQRRVRAYADELRSDDIVNLQFTRCVGCIWLRRWRTYESDLG